MIIKKISLHFLFLLLTTLLCHGQDEAIVIKPDLVNSINVGKGPGELGYRSVFGGSGILPSYPTFANQEVFILDNQNWRINIYNSDMQFEREVQITGSIRTIPIQAGIISLYENGDISASSGVLVRIGVDGKIVYEIPADQFPKNVASHAKYWLYKNYMVFYKDSGDLSAIDAKGNLLKAEETLSIYEQMKESSSMRKESAQMRDAIDQYIVTNKIALLGDKLLTDKPSIYFGFYRVIRTNRKSSFKNILDQGVRESTGYIYGFDEEDNSYWQFSEKNGKLEIVTVYVLSRSGDILSRFRIDGRGFPIIAPNGDIYMIDEKWERNAPPTFLYYRVKRKW